MSLANQACGIEQELIELVGRRERALAQGRQEEVAQLSAGIRELQGELARVSDLVAAGDGLAAGRMTIIDPSDDQGLDGKGENEDLEADEPVDGDESGASAAARKRQRRKETAVQTQPSFQASDVEDMIGRAVYGHDGDKIGKINNIYLDDHTKQPAWMAVSTGRFGGVTFVPLVTASRQGEDFAVPYGQDLVKDAPTTAEVDGALSEDEVTELYRHYGLDHSPTAPTRSGEELPVDRSSEERGRARQVPQSRARTLIGWLFRSRQTGRIVIVQFPNVPLGVFLVASVLRWLLRPTGRLETGLLVLATGALIWWAADELIRGVNPWRRLLGGAALVAQLVILVTR